MKLTIKLALGGALALASVHAFADVSVPPPPYDGPLNLPSAGNGSAILTLFSNNNSTPYSYEFNLGLNFNDLLPANGINNPGTSLTWALTGLSVPTSVATSDLRWSVTAASTLGAVTVAGNFKLLTTADPGVTLSTVQTTTTGVLVSTNQANNDFLTNLNAFSSTNPRTTVNPADPTYANTKWNTSLTQLGFSAATDTSSSANFFELVSGRGNTSLTTDTQLAGVWTLDLANLLLTYTVAGEGGGSPVPLPAGVWLLLSSLAGMGVLRRRKTAADAA